MFDDDVCAVFLNLLNLGPLTLRIFSSIESLCSRLNGNLNLLLLGWTAAKDKFSMLALRLRFLKRLNFKS